MRKIFALCLMTGLSANAVAYQDSDLHGTWCFYEQEAMGNTVKERVTITLNEDGTYKWSDTFWKQSGTWSVTDNRLIMSDVGSHKLISVSGSRVEMTRGSTMRMRKGSC